VSNSVKVALLVCTTAILLAVIASITSVTIEGGDVGNLIRNFGLVAVFLVTNIPILVAQMKSKEVAQEAKEAALATSEQTQQIATSTAAIEKKVNGELHSLVSGAVTTGIGTAVQALANNPVNASDPIIEGQENRADGVQGS